MQEMKAVDREIVWARRAAGDANAHFKWTLPGGQKPKDLVGIPWMVAFALRADGWYLRSDIIWSKPNPMPESVTDRPTKAHEYLFLLAKSERYFYDAEAIREPHKEPWRGHGKHESSSPHNGRIDGGAQAAFTVGVREYNPAGRNRRTVWEIATEPFPGAHFATFPTALVEPCVLAGCPEGGVVLDPFAGSGTVGVVATRKGRSFIGLELKPEYCEMARARIRDDAPLLNDAAARNLGRAPESVTGRLL